MVTFPIGLGTDMTPDKPGTGKRSGDQSWREPPVVAREGRGERGEPSGIDWENDPKYFTPQPAPKKHYGTHHAPFAETLPDPIERLKKISVKPKQGTFYYEGLPLPPDRFEAVLPTPDIMQAIHNGDLERGPDPTPGAGAPGQPRPVTPPRRPPPPRPPAE